MEQPLQQQPQPDPMYNEPCLLRRHETTTTLGGSDSVRDSQLVGVPVALARDVDMAERENGCVPNLEVAVADGAVLKRKRGRPARGLPKTTPPLRKKRDEEDVCFICFDGGSLVLCDRRGCPKAYHPACIKRDEAFFRSKAKWNCGWHICSICQKASHYMCYTCTYSLCKGCTKDADFVCVRGNKGLCGICMRTIMLIENGSQGNKATCEVDFDDKSSWEYLFKVYWMYLKEKLSLTLNELLRAKNPWKGAPPMSCKIETPHELYHLKDDKGYGVLNDVGCRTQDLPTTREPIGNICIIENEVYPNGSTNVGVVRAEAPGVALDVSSLLLSTGMEQPFNDFVNDQPWHYQDPTGKVQGPFSMLQLYKWNASGHFPPDLRIWRIDEKQDNSILLTDVLSGKCSKNMSLPYNSQLLSLGASVTLDNRDNSQDGGRNETRNEIHADSQIIKQSGEQKVDDTCTQSNDKDESVRSNGWQPHSSSWTIPADGNNNEGQSGTFERREESSKCEILCHDQLHLYPSVPSTAFSDKLNENPSEKLREGNGIDGNSEEDNGTHGLNRTFEGQSNSGLSYQKQSDSEENSGQSSGQNWRYPHVNSSSNCLVATLAHVSVRKTSPQKLGFDLHSSTPVTSSSNCWDSPSTFVSVAKQSPTNPEIDFLELNSHKPNNAESLGQSAENKHHTSSNVPVQEAGPCWSTASSLVNGGAPLPEVTVEWRRCSPAPPNPSVEDWDSNVVSASSMKPAESVGDCAATPSSISGQLTHSSPSHPACNTSTWQAIIGEPTDFSSLVDESVSDLLAEVEAMESLGGLESPTSIMKCGEELTEGSKTDCLNSADGLSPMLDAGKGDALSSTGDLHLPSQSTAAEEPLWQADVHHHHHHQRKSGDNSSRSSEVEGAAKNISVSGNQWELGSENPPIVPSTATWDMSTDTTWRLGSENTNLGWDGMDQGNANRGWGVGQMAVQENRSTNSYASIVNLGFGGSQTRYGSDRFSAPRDQGFHGHGRESGCGRGRTMWNGQPLFGVGNGGTYRSPPKGQRVCKFYESGYCKKGASCDYLHP